eukprot:5649132-Pyramimonas_sp.AAC.1
MPRLTRIFDGERSNNGRSMPKMHWKLVFARQSSPNSLCNESTACSAPHVEPSLKGSAVWETCTVPPTLGHDASC